MSQPTSADQLKPAVGQLLGIAKTVERDDLIDRIKAAAIRATRSDTVVCVVGEFKQGKSSLVNSLVRRNVCPVDDDLATSAITMVRFGEKPSATVRFRDGEESASAQIQIDELDQWVSEIGNPGNIKGVERVEIAVPSPPMPGVSTITMPCIRSGLGTAISTRSTPLMVPGLPLSPCPCTRSSIWIAAPVVSLPSR